MQKLSLTSRPAKIGGSVNTRTEMHGTEEVPGQDIPISGIILSVEELRAITDEETAGEGLFKVEGDQYIPRFMCFDSLKVAHKFENATIKLSGGVPSTTYKNAKIKGITLTPVGGAMTEMHCTLQVHPENGDPSAQQLLNAKVKISLKAELEEEEADDPELPLDHQDSVPIELDPEARTNPDVEETKRSKRKSRK